MNLQDILEADASQYCICHQCKKIVLKADVPQMEYLYQLCMGDHSDTTILQECKNCYNERNQEQISKSNKMRLALMKQYLDNCNLESQTIE